MPARLAPGVAVLVIGPTINGCGEAIGRRAVVDRLVTRGERRGLFLASGDGWSVTFDRPMRWSRQPPTSGAIFPATSLMPLDGLAESEAITAGVPVGAEV